jgi:hypothetical protein
MARTAGHFSRRRLGVAGALVATGIAAALFAWSRGPQAPPGTHLLPRGERHWDEWIELVPAILPPRTRLGNDLTRVFVRFPPHGRLTLDGSERTALRVPVGTTVDRVEYRQIAGAWRAVDVRGTEFGRAGAETFRAYRAHSPERPDALFGVRWSRADPSAAERAKATMSCAMKDGMGFAPRGAEAEARQARYERLLQCPACHGYRSPERATGTDGWPRRATDASGLYTLLAALANESMTETYRPRDANARRAHVSYRCGDASAPARKAGWLRCRDGSVARAQLDVARSLTTRDPSTRALCKSRRALAAFLSDPVRRAYATELRDCGIDPGFEPGTTFRWSSREPGAFAPKGE